ncbi:hypothetical protein DIJ64_02105 [Mycobacterium leprae]|uniref:Uncharacterized protein n=1 Tax=Mycobacterium leprae TaxID=1769 RepID=A0AAD0KRH6_MYCLR|nr:hypothetical protein DIJ64_02105 [Mycobacterium leprae]OAR20608.1 hypothetical protein A8144_10265 [Mycobacterium leprae 3125609]OAX70780.1 hypothetical protein A3216_09800 [Mycobacterium leprae 7935681]
MCGSVDVVVFAQFMCNGFGDLLGRSASVWTIVPVLAKHPLPFSLVNPGFVVGSTAATVF